MKQTWEVLKNYLGYVAVTIAVLIPLDASQVYYSYAEYNSISSLLGFLPTFSSFVILFNIFMMPCSWMLCFLAIPQMLPQLPFRKTIFAKVIVILSLLFMILTIVNLSIFYASTAPGLTSALQTSILSYLENADTRSSWNRAAALIQCCGVTGVADFYPLGFTVAPCSQYGSGCVNAIIANFSVIWIWSLLAQAGAIFIGVNGVFPKSKNEPSDQNKEGTGTKSKDDTTTETDFGVNSSK